MKDNIEKMAEEYTSDLVTQSGNDKKAIIIGRDYLHKIMADFALFYHEQRMKELWHTPDQKPEEHKTLLVDIEYGGIRSASYYLGGFWMTNPASWEKEDPVLTVITWAYLSDLTKTEEG